LRLRRYQSPDEDSGRWEQFSWRPGDIVISTRSKHGTTWMQMICALLVFQSPDLPEPLPRLSPWVDWLGVPIDELLQRLDQQRHRRFVKTHTPLDGLPIRDEASYVVIVRHPLDAAISLYYQGDNLDREKMHELTGAPLPTRQRPALREWLLDWINADVDPAEELDSLPGVAWHVTDVWQRRDEANVVLVHYADLTADLDREMRGIANRLNVAIDEATWPALVEAASFSSMRSRANEVAPATGVLKSSAAFFRRGARGEARELLSADEIAVYDERIAGLVPRDLVEWLNR
jgi:aryl sulfotransferase